MSRPVMKISLIIEPKLVLRLGRNGAEGGDLLTSQKIVKLGTAGLDRTDHFKLSEGVGREKDRVGTVYCEDNREQPRQGEPAGGNFHAANNLKLC